MSGRLAPFWALLVQDQAGRRALVETLADWRDERAVCETPRGRRRADANAVVPVARVLLGIAYQQIRSASPWRALASTLLVASIYPAMLMLRFALGDPRTDVGVFLLDPEQSIFWFLIAVGLPGSSLRDFRVPYSLAPPSPIAGRMALSAVLGVACTAVLGMAPAVAVAFVFGAPTFVLSGEAMRRWASDRLVLLFPVLTGLFGLGLLGLLSDLTEMRALLMWTVLVAMWTLLALLASRQRAVAVE